MINLKYIVGSVWFISGVLGLAQPASAGGPAPTPQALGTAEALLTFCGKLVPADASKYSQRIQILVQDADAREVAEVRKSEAYRQAYEGITERVKQADPGAAREACAKFLSGQ